MKNVSRLSLATLLPFFALSLVACSNDDTTCDTQSAGAICTLVGSGSNGYDRNADSESLPALEAKFALPQDTLTAADGTIYILDWNNHRLREYDPDTQEVSWIAGRGELGGDLDDPANGDFNHPTNIIFDPSGEKIVMAAWHNSKIRIVDPDTGLVSDTCGDGKRAYFGDDGPAMSASLDLPAAIAYGPQGNLVIMDQANQVLRSVDAAGNITRLAGSCVVDAPAPGGPGKCDDPTPCPDGDNGPSGKSVCGDPVMHCSKPCTPGYAGDDGPALQMRMSQPFGQAAHPAGRMVFADDGTLFFADTSNHLIRRIDPDGTIRRVAGQPPVDGVAQSGYEGDGGKAIDAMLSFPVDLALGDDGTLYVSDVRNHCIRAIDPQGNINAVVGVCGEYGFDGDGGPATEALLNLPFGIEYDDGRLIVTDTGNNRIRTVLLP